MILLLLACSGQKESVLDSGLCAAAPVETWANFGEAFVTQSCQSCHSSTQSNRQGAPEEVTFDTADQVWALSDRVLARAAAEPPTMPPQGGTSEEDRERLRIWLSCGTPGQ
jgi:uncharacterized membrane protein